MGNNADWRSKEGVMIIESGPHRPITNPFPAPHRVRSRNGGTSPSSLPHDLEIALVEVDAGTADLLDLAVHTRQLVEHDLENVAVIFVRSPKRVESVGKNPVSQRQGYLVPVMVGRNLVDASGEAMRDFASPGHGQPDSHRRWQSANCGSDGARKIAVH